MRKSLFLLLAAGAATAGCSQSADSGNKTNLSANTITAAKLKKVPYCFFTSANSKGWTASRSKDGNVTVKGKAYLADARYKAALGTAEIDGTTANAQLKMPQNDTGYASADGWWDVTSTIPNSASIDKVEVLCGAKTLASLEIKR